MKDLRSEKGAAALEFAFVAPMLALLLGGIIEVGNLVQTAIVASNAAREGARYAAVRDTYAATAAVNYLTSALAGRTDVTLPSIGQVSITGGAQVGDQVTVSLPVTVTFNMPVIQKVLGGSITLNGGAAMRVSQK
jgi:Flp pilus assembly protein TadG